MDSPTGRHRDAGALASGAGSASTSSLPFRVNGSVATSTTALGSMCSGSMVANAVRGSAGGAAPAAGTTYTTSRGLPSAEGRTTATPSRDAGKSAQCGLDVRELDSETANLDLTIDATEILEFAVLAPADEVAGAIEPLLLRQRRIVHEAFRRQIVRSEISLREDASADIQLARDADGNRFPVRVEDQQSRVRRSGGRSAEAAATARTPRSTRTP